ncbi:hypothetical protein FSPOR_7064 [Fusarium sporotrichioides]|uniref:Uncharacterized protein n=1 Tax=Fusarium sporotrichioides TaxID=5514 RepID=A0A395S074_FUSSP|nr:hypothetical protein FSPOR_7064 [Fusarium sporotrichioides]
MDRLFIHPPPSIKDIFKSIRERSSRSAYVTREFDSLLAQAESGPTTDTKQFLHRYIDPRNVGLAITAFSIHRFPFNPIPPGGGLDRWVLEYWPVVLSNPKILHEFIQLADNINQLSAIYASVPGPQHHWELVYRHALHESHGNTFLGIAASDTPDLPLNDLKVMDMIRLRIQAFGNQDLPGESPTDIAGNPIDTELFARVQQSFWLEELQIRATNLKDLYDSNRLASSRDIQNTIDQVLELAPQVDILPFQRLIKWQRLIITAHKAGISDTQTINSFFRILETGRFHFLGVQGLAACLPSYGASYELLYIFKLGSVNCQINTFFMNLDSESQEAWHDGWFEKYPVSGSIDHLWLRIEYLPGDDGWHGRFFEHEDTITTAAHAMGLDDEDIEFLWGPNPEISADPPALEAPALDIADELFASIQSQYDVEDIRNWWSYDPDMFNQYMGNNGTKSSQSQHPGHLDG